MDPQNHWAAQAPHKANTDTSLNRWLSSPETTQNDDTKFPAINASNAENDQMQHSIHGDWVDTQDIKARENPPLKLGSGTLPLSVAKLTELSKH